MTRYKLENYNILIFLILLNNCNNYYSSSILEMVEKILAKILAMQRKLPKPKNPSYLSIVVPKSPSPQKIRFKSTFGSKKKGRICQGVIHILRNHQGGGGRFRNYYATVIFALSNAEFDYGRVIT